jgi:creatinine amidohydrolase
MKPACVTLVLLTALHIFAGAQTPGKSKSKGVLLEQLTWVDAEKVLTPDTIVVIPLGAAAKEHGPHLPLNADWLQAEYLKLKVLQRSNVVVAPTVNYHFYPPFAEYPGSTTLSRETSSGLIVDICRSLARYGPRRFYVINIGLTTVPVLRSAADLLRDEGIVLRYTDLLKAVEPASSIVQQEGGTHADEIETSVVLYMYPDKVDMKKAVKDFRPRKGFPTRDPKNTEGTYSPTGVYGDATLATREKGRKFTDAIMLAILRDLEALRNDTLPPKVK